MVTDAKQWLWLIPILYGYMGLRHATVAKFVDVQLYSAVIIEN
jgi:hypothetical protein